MSMILKIAIGIILGLGVTMVGFSYVAYQGMQSIANAMEKARAPDEVYSLIEFRNGQMYTLDYDLTADDCLKAMKGKLVCLSDLEISSNPMFDLNEEPERESSEDFGD